MEHHCFYNRNLFAYVFGKDITVYSDVSTVKKPIEASGNINPAEDCECDDEDDDVSEYNDDVNYNYGDKDETSKNSTEEDYVPSGKKDRHPKISQSESKDLVSRLGLPEYGAESFVKVEHFCRSSVPGKVWTI